MNPFLFTRHAPAVDKLVHRLERLDLHIVAIEDSDSAYVPAKMTVTIPWMGTAKILWQRRWWPDGEKQEDDVVVLKFEDHEREIANIHDLTRQKLDKSLSEVVTDHIVDALIMLIRSKG